MLALRNRLYRFASAAQRIIVPGLRNSQFFYKDSLLNHIGPETAWLDLGCGHQLMPVWMPGDEHEQHEVVRRCRMAVGIDADHQSLRENAILRNRVVHGDIERLPFPDESFDLVTANVVVEHVDDPHRLLREIHRVLRPQGRFLFHTPNFWGYPTLLAWLLPEQLRPKLVYFLQRRLEKDVFPTRYRFNTPSTIHSVAGESGLRVADLHVVEHSAQAVMLGPVVILELLWIALSRLRVMTPLRTSIIAVLQKDGTP